MGDSVRNYILTCDTFCRNKLNKLPLKAGLLASPRTKAENVYILMIAALPSQNAEAEIRVRAATINQFSLSLGIYSSLVSFGISKANCSVKFVNKLTKVRPLFTQSHRGSDNPP